MSDLINKERMADAENLTKQVQSIRSEMDEIQNEYNRKAAPYRQRIKQQTIIILVCLPKAQYLNRLGQFKTLQRYVNSL